MNTFPELLRNSLAAISGNLNTSFSGQLSDLLQQQGVSMNQLWHPPVDVLETDTSLLVQMNVAGVIPDSIDVDFFNNSVGIKGERCPSALADETGVVQHRREIICGKFERKILLPFSITQRESVNIHFNNGVLSIMVDKTVEERNKFSLKVNEKNDE